MKSLKNDTIVIDRPSAKLTAIVEDGLKRKKTRMDKLCSYYLKELKAGRQIL